MKSNLKSLFGLLFSTFGKPFTKDKLTIFCYHDVSYKPSEFSLKYNLNVNPDIFEYQINLV